MEDKISGNPSIAQISKGGAAKSRDKEVAPTRKMVKYKLLAGPGTMQCQIRVRFESGVKKKFLVALNQP